MSEMVERVARAIAGQPSGDLDDRWRRKAQAGIEAMREPTEEMYLAALKTRGLQDIAVAANKGGYRATIENITPNSPLQQLWRAMIDVALNGG